MQRVLRSTVIEHNAERVWELVRDFNSHGDWHPAIDASRIERGEAVDRVGCIRRFTLVDGQELREQLLSLSDMEMTYSYCLLDTPVPLFNYVAHFRIFPVTDSDHAYCEWEGNFDTREGEEATMAELVGEGIYMAGFQALREYFDNQRTAT
jgi:hypothetical protein